MSFIVKDKVYEVAAEGLHNATITRVEDLGLVETNFGTKDRLRVTFTMNDQKDKEGNAVEVRMSATKSLHNKSSFGKLLQQLKISVQGGAFNPDELVGLKVQVVVAQKENEGKTYANIVTVIPNRTASKALTSTDEI